MFILRHVTGPDHNTDDLSKETHHKNKANEKSNVIIM